MYLSRWAYQGVLRRDTDADVDEFLCRDAHYTFIEPVPQKSCKRNPRVFDGQYLTSPAGLTVAFGLISNR